jgi:hypothetical protein
VIKRLCFATRHAGLPSDEFGDLWRGALDGVRHAPPDVMPMRLALCFARPEFIAGPRHDGISLEWFDGRDHLARYEAWFASSEWDEKLHRVIDRESSPIVIADEYPMRGADWLVERWKDGGPRFKHMAIARRAKGLTLAEFFNLWKSRAGKVGTSPIPDNARGTAYIQNWPLLSGEEWEYDALNEVYFDDVEGLQTRIGYFDEMRPDQREDDLVSEAWFIAAEEELVLNRP